MLFPHLDTPVRVTGVSVRMVEDGSKVCKKPDKFKAENKQVHAQLQLHHSQWSCWWTLYFTLKLMVGRLVPLIWVRHQKCFHLSFSLWLRLLAVSRSFHQSLQHCITCEAFTSLTFFVLGVDLLLLRSSPAGQSGGGDEEGQQSGEEAVVCHRQHKPHQEGWGHRNAC